MSAVPDEEKPTIGELRRLFLSELRQKVYDPARSDGPGTPGHMLCNLATVVLDSHELDSDGTCVGHFNAQEEQREWPCDEIIRMGRIYGVWWTRT